MSTKIDVMIEEAKKQAQQIEQQYNQNAQYIQELTNHNRQLQAQGHEIASRINTLTELKGLGNAAFQSLDDAAAAPTETAAPETEQAPEAVEADPAQS